MHMFVKQYSTDKYTIIAELANSNELISFDKCFIIDGSYILNRSFKIRDDRVYCKNKLKNYDNVLYKIECKGKVEYKNLQTFLPTVFDFKVIRKNNEKSFINANHKLIVKLSQDILDQEKVKSILEKKYL